MALPGVCLHAFQCNIVAKYVFVVLHDFLYLRTPNEMAAQEIEENESGH